MVHVCIAATASEYQSFYTTIFKDYNKRLLPVVNIGDVADIALSTELISINDFNGLTGELSVTILFSLKWTEERIYWTPLDYGNLSSFLVSPEELWYPQLFLRQSSDRITDVCNTSIMMRLFSDGTVTWTPGNVLKSTCSMDVTFFPFDKQLCELTLGSFSYTVTESTLYSTEEIIGLSFFFKNSQWELSSATIQNVTYGSTSFIHIQLSLIRRSQFFVVYIIVPIIVLGVLNSMVFVMPASSGERTSVAITTFLAFVVYMELINGIVPENSEPMAYIYYFLNFLMMYSSSIMLLCIVSLRIYDIKTDVPVTVKQAIWFLTFRCFKCKNIKKRVRVEVDTDETVSRISENVLTPRKIRPESSDEANNVTSDDISDITWYTVGKTFDRYTFGILNIAFIGFTVTMLNQLNANLSL